MKNTYDAVIIGAGVNGLTQAAALTHSGFRVAIIDREPPRIDHTKEYDLRAYAINRYTQSCLEKWNIWQLLDHTRVAAYPEVQLAFQASKPLLDLKASDDHEPNLGHIVEQKNWRNAALEVLENSELCDFYWEHSLSKVELPKRSDAKEALVTLDFATSNPLYTKLLIGADGTHSKVRTLFDIAVDEFPCEQTAMIFNIQTEHPHNFEARQYFTSQGIIAFLPLADEHLYSMVWSIPNDQLLITELPDEALASELNNISQRYFGEIRIDSKRQTFPLMQRQAKRYIGEHMALIGDAAHTIHPLAGQGANLGVADAAALIQQLCRARAQHRPLGSQSILRPYERARRSAAWQMMGLMDTFQQFSQNSFIQTSSTFMAHFLNKTTFLKNILSRFALYDFTK